MNFSSGKAASQDPAARARDNQAKFIKDSVTRVEKSFSTVCGQLGSVNRRNARLRDKYDEMAKFLIDHANLEQGPLKKSLTTFAEHISAVQDYRQAFIDRLAGKVIQPLSSYKVSCKTTQTDLNRTLQSRGREMKTHRQLEQLRNKAPSDTRQITRAETDLQRATLEVNRTTQTLEQTIDRFEGQRVRDLKAILSEYVHIEMLFHAKALERLTACYQDLQNLNLEDHIAIFRNTLRPSHVQQRIDMVQQQMGPYPQQMGPNGQQMGPYPQQMGPNGQRLPPGQQQQQPPVTDIYAVPNRARRNQSQDMEQEEDEDRQEYDEEYDDEVDEEEESDYESEEEEEESESPEPVGQQQRTRPW